jgi:outer membrane lipoprotein carrier protein
VRGTRSAWPAALVLAAAASAGRPAEAGDLAAGTAAPARAPAAAGTTTPATAGAAAPGAAGSAGEDCPEPAVIADRLQARYDATAAFRASFRQETILAALGQREEARGAVAFKRPGKMRWDFETPERQQIIADGATLWIYQPADNQVLKAPFEAAFVSTTPVSFLTGVGRIKDDFRPEADPRGCDATRAHLRLVSKGAQDVGRLTLTVDRATFDILEAEVTDPLGNVTRVAFADLRRNVEIADAEFEFRVPPGVDAPAGR